MPTPLLNTHRCGFAAAQNLITRRSFFSTLGSASLLLYAACRDSTAPEITGPARLRLNARRPSRGTPLGVDVLTNAALQRAYISVPPGYRPTTPAPLVIAFHGAGGRGDDWIGGYSALTDAAGMVLLSPNSLGLTWDAIDGEFGPDVEFVNAMLEQLFDRCVIDMKRIGLIGFSDGASYSLSLGLANGDHVGQVIGHSPGYYVNEPQYGHPAFFVSRGTLDQVFPFDGGSAQIVPALRALGDDVTYVEFDGAHEVPAAVAGQAVNWMSTRFRA